MANENKKINELVDADSDSTSELEALTVRLFQEEKPGTRILESEENTFDFSEIDNTASNSGSLSELQVELQQSASIIERLQYDHQQLHSRYLGLQAEVATRQQLNDKLSNSLSKADKELGEVHSLLADREQLVQELQSQIRDRDLELHNLTRLTHELKSAKSELESGDEISKARKKLVEYEGANASLNATLSGLRNQQQQTEQYADELRRQLADLRTESQSAVSERAALRVELSNAESKIAALEGRLVKSSATLDIAEGELHAANERHEHEMRLLRFELGESQETLAENSQITEQLSTDLAENRGYRLELERMLTDVEAQSQAQIEALEQQVRDLESVADDYENKLEIKNDAINALLEEMARQGKPGHPAPGSYDPKFDTEVGVETLSSRPHPGERVTRLLIGRIDKQELRFPLFKNRLTIGRTQQNDIYLKAQFISRRHAVVVTEGDSTRIIDWGSKNGVYVNSKRITEHFLKSGDKVAIGTVEFRYEELPKRDPT